MKKIAGLEYPIGSIWTCSDERKEGRNMFWTRVKEGWKFSGYNYKNSIIPTAASMRRCFGRPHKLDIFEEAE